MHDSEPPLWHGTDQNNFNLAAAFQQQYRAAFHAAVAAGDVKPLTFPWSFVGSFFLPVLYLSIPHTQRPWLYRMRWAVAAAVVYLNVRLMQTTSAGNEAVAYATGLIGVWGTIWSLTLLIFTRPQWEAARVQRRPRRPTIDSESKKPAITTTTTTTNPPDESASAAWPHSEYFWQPFPAGAPLLVRLGWTADLFISFRGAGWNHSIPAIPHPPLPHAPPPRGERSSGRGGDIGIVVIAEQPARVDLVPLASRRTGASRSPTYAAFLRARLAAFALSYLTIDLLTVTMRADPYFVLGPDCAHHPYGPYPPLPRFLAALPLRDALALPLLRGAAALAGILAGLHLYHSLLQLVVVFCAGPVLGVGSELWQHPTLFGSLPATVARRGLPGLWGGWWHQTFRRGFVCFARWLLFPLLPRHGSRDPGGHHGGSSGSGSGILRSKEGRAAAEAGVAFLLSGLLHAAGGITAASTTPSVPWTPVAFFALQAVGVVGQTAICALLRRPIERFAPRWARSAGNLAFAAAWLLLTGWGLVDDMSRAGLWLFEPVPVSPLRMMGLSLLPGDGRWWRWDGEYGLRWYKGRRWWESGIRL